VPAWLQLALARALGAGSVAYLQLIDCPSAATTPIRRHAFAARLFAAWARYDRRHFTPTANPWARCSLPGDGAGSPRGDPGADAPLPAAFDLVIDAEGLDVADAIAGTARRGLWQVITGGDRTGEPPFAPGRVGIVEMLEHRSITSISWMERADASASLVLLDTTSTETSRVSPTVTAVRLAWLATEMLVRLLARAALGQERATDDRAVSIDPIPATSLDRPGSAVDPVAWTAPGERVSASHRGGVTGFIAARVSAWLARAFQERWFEEHWEVHYALSDEPVVALERFTAIPASADRYWADPHVLARDGGFQVFVEEYPRASRRGRIATFAIDRGGAIGRARTALQTPHHLSYPFVFDHRGRTFMVPESGATDSVELYECVAFPHRWEHRRTLLAGVYAVDATLHHEAGRWWLFASVAANPGRHPHDELSLFSSDDLLDGTWTLHPGDAIVADPHRARPAGALFELAGKRCRPAQDGVGEYGYAVRLMAIETLTPAHYGERETLALLPDGMPGWRGIHTYTHVPGITLIDVKTRRAKWSVQRVRRRVRRARERRDDP